MKIAKGKITKAIRTKFDITHGNVAFDSFNTSYDVIVDRGRAVGNGPPPVKLSFNVKKENLLIIV